ncbi:MAG: LPS export ABC transporter permease LptG [Desulfuromonadales bacterium]|nr:LPS export ABC transporter permease LptG [Desulfuromonadales bacterium]
MTILSRYISLSFCRFFLMILATMLSVYGLVEFIEKVDDFIEYGATARAYFWYPLYNLPVMLANTLPLAILLGAFATIAALSRTSQLTAMFGGGISFSQISRPLFLCGFALSLLSLAGNLWLVPMSAGKVSYLLGTEIKGNDRPDERRHNLIFRDGDLLISIGHSFPEKGELVGVTIIEFNQQFLPIQRIDAARAEHVGQGHWRFDDVVVWQFSPEEQSVRTYARHAELVKDIGRPPEDMLQLWSEPGHMRQSELRQFIARLETEGYNPSEYRVEEQMRIARAAMPLIMILLGVPFAMQRGRQVSFALGVAISLGIFLVYYLGSASFAAFGNAGLLPPLVAAWSANVLMILVGAWLFLNIRD